VIEECNPSDGPTSEIRPLKRLTAFSVKKRNDTPNEDHWCESPDGRVFAVSDGASVSFDPARWADVLTRRFCHNQEISREWILEAIAEHGSVYDRETMPWLEQAAFDRGSFATLLGVAFSPDWRGARVFAMGDTILAFVGVDQIVRTIPNIKVEELDQVPALLSTNPLENRWIDADTISAAWQDLNITSHEVPTLLLMTDALGRWLLEAPNFERVSVLLSLREGGEFCEFVDRERSAGRLKRDDTTLVVIGASGAVSADP
jgi:hypothetical protein